MIFMLTLSDFDSLLICTAVVAGFNWELIPFKIGVKSFTISLLRAYTR